MFTDKRRAKSNLGTARIHKLTRPVIQAVRVSGLNTLTSGCRAGGGGITTSHSALEEKDEWVKDGSDVKHELPQTQPREREREMLEPHVIRALLQLHPDTVAVETLSVLQGKRKELLTGPNKINKTG